MKRKLIPFVAGVMATIVVFCGTITAFASSGALTISVNPINVLVNGKVFQPKDSQGNDVMVFTYNGTTYAPLRALAEAYGLEVGYDGRSNTATVNAPSGNTTVDSTPATTITSYKQFEKLWRVTEKPVTNYGSEKVFMVEYAGDLSATEFKELWKSMAPEFIKSSAEALAADIQKTVPGFSVTAYFSYGSYGLGSANAFGDYEFSNFDIAKAWVK